MTIFTYILTDLTEFQAEPIKIELDTAEEAVTYGTRIAREMLAQMPDIVSKGMCVTVHDAAGEQISVVPIDPLN